MRREGEDTIGFNVPPLELVLPVLLLLSTPSTSLLLLLILLLLLVLLVLLLLLPTSAVATSPLPSELLARRSELISAAFTVGIAGIPRDFAVEDVEADAASVDIGTASKGFCCCGAPVERRGLLISWTPLCTTGLPRDGDRLGLQLMTGNAHKR